jgi:hypothetical protein
MFNLMQFVVPASLIDGWVCYFWDMKRKIIHVLDPLNLTGISDARRCVHEDVTAVLHGAFVGCVGVYFHDWVISDTPWVRLYPVLGRKNFAEYV